MKLPNLLLISFLLLISSWAWGQQSSSETQAGTPAPAGAPATPRAQRRAHMQAMCKEHMAAMKADTEKMHSAFDKMKANVDSISNAEEKARWQANVDMWQAVLNHHDQMLKHMEGAQSRGMGCGMMMGGMGMDPMPMGPMSAPSKPAPETKPQ